MTEGTVVISDAEVNKSSTMKKNNMESQHRRVHSVPVSFDDLYFEENELREPMSHDDYESDSNKENFRILPEKVNIMEYIKNEKWNEVEMCCREFPEIIRKEVQVAIYGEQIRCLPLHFACRTNPPVSTIDALIVVFPEALIIGDSLNRAPIHFACRFDASPEVVKTVLAACPDAAKLPDQDGNLPLHLACSFATCEVSKTLFRHFPEASLVSNSKNKLPVHLLCSKSDVNVSFLSSLVSKYSEMVSTADGQGALPIHLAIVHRASLSVVKFLLSSLPRSVYVRNDNGKTPLDLAKLIYRSPDFHPILQTVKDAYDTNGTSICRAVNSLVSQYNSVAAKRAKENNDMIRHKFLTVYPNNFNEV